MNMFAILFNLFLSTHSNIYAHGVAREKMAEIFAQRYWSGQINPKDLTVINGDGRRMEVTVANTVTIKKRDESVVICKNSVVSFSGAEINYIDAKSPGCKVGDLEAVEGTTIAFSEGTRNFLTSLVTAKAVRLRGYTWPAKSELLFYIDEKINPILYAVVLGADLKGTDYKAGQKVYVGTLGDPDAQKTGPLSLTGRDPTL